MIEAKVSRSFDEMVEIDYGGDDFHDCCGYVPNNRYKGSDGAMKICT